MQIWTEGIEDKRKSYREIHSEKTTALLNEPISMMEKGYCRHQQETGNYNKKGLSKTSGTITTEIRLLPTPKQRDWKRGLGTHKGTDESRLRQSNTESSPYSERRQFGRLRDESKEERSQNGNELFGDQFGLSWLQVATDFCRMDDGVSEEFYKLETSDRVARLKALGNAIVPQVAYEIFKAIKKNYYG
jgi:site-specific DNA-cytosine methylase